MTTKNLYVQTDLLVFCSNDNKCQTRKLQNKLFGLAIQHQGRSFVRKIYQIIFLQHDNSAGFLRWSDSFNMPRSYLKVGLPCRQIDQPQNCSAPNPYIESFSDDLFLMALPTEKVVIAYAGSKRKPITSCNSFYMSIKFKNISNSMSEVQTIPLLLQKAIVLNCQLFFSNVVNDSCIIVPETTASVSCSHFCSTSIRLPLW